MDAITKDQWRWKFYRLTLHLNAVILFIALTILALVFVPAPYKIPSFVILLILDIALVYTFNRNYHAAKAWLREHSTPKDGG